MKKMKNKKQIIIYIISTLVLLLILIGFVMNVLPLSSTSYFFISSNENQLWDYTFLFLGVVLFYIKILILGDELFRIIDFMILGLILVIVPFFWFNIVGIILISTSLYLYNKMVSSKT